MTIFEASNFTAREAIVHFLLGLWPAGRPIKFLGNPKIPSWPNLIAAYVKPCNTCMRQTLKFISFLHLSSTYPVSEIFKSRISMLRSVWNLWAPNSSLVKVSVGTSQCFLQFDSRCQRQDLSTIWIQSCNTGGQFEFYGRAARSMNIMYGSLTPVWTLVLDIAWHSTMPAARV